MKKDDIYYIKDLTIRIESLERAVNRFKERFPEWEPEHPEGIYYKMCKPCHPTSPECDDCDPAANELEESLALAYCTERNKHKITDPDLIFAMASQARRWAVEVVEKMKSNSKNGRWLCHCGNDLFDVICADELISRLKGDSDFVANGAKSEMDAPGNKYGDKLGE